MEEHGWRNVHEEKPNKNKDETTPKSEKSSCSILPMVLLKVVPVVVPQIQCIAVCDGKTISLLECSETVQVPIFLSLSWSFFVTLQKAFLPFFISLFSPFSLCVSISVFLFLTPLYLMFPYLFFLQRRFCVSSFGLTHFSSLFWSWSLCFHTSSSPFFLFLHLRLCFFLQKNQKFLWSILPDEMSFFFFFFEPSLLRCLVSCFFLLASSVVPYLFHVFTDFERFLTLLFLIFFFINLLFGSLRKIVVLFWTKIQKISLILLKKMIFCWTNPCFSWFWPIFATN